MNCVIVGRLVTEKQGLRNSPSILLMLMITVRLEFSSKEHYSIQWLPTS